MEFVSYLLVCIALSLKLGNDGRWNVKIKKAWARLILYLIHGTNGMCFEYLIHVTLYLLLLIFKKNCKKLFGHKMHTKVLSPNPKQSHFDFFLSHNYSWHDREIVPDLSNLIRVIYLPDIALFIARLKQPLLEAV